VLIYWIIIANMSNKLRLVTKKMLKHTIRPLNYQIV
jgi:hypothetical protein